MKPANRTDFWLLCLWIALGLGLRFVNLAAKPLWADEFSTIVFSLGNSFLTVPLDQVIAAETLLAPLKPNHSAGLAQVVERLVQESNHPPLYFLLNHLWLKLVSPLDGLVSAWNLRSLSALIGAISIPLSYWLGWLGFRSRVAAQISAALMAVSPFGIYLAQEGRHYTLAICWILLSLCCLMAAARQLRDRMSLPLGLCLGWIVINGLGIATHYFVALTLGAEAVVLLGLGLVQSWREGGIWHPSSHWRRIWLVAAGTAATGLVWLPLLQDIQGSELTRWIYSPSRSGLAWLEPIAQALAGWATLLYLLPIQADSQLIRWLSGGALVLLLLWTLPKLYRGLRVQMLNRDARLGVMALSLFVCCTALLFFGITYSLDADLTSAFRYNFVFFPGAIALIGGSLASSWDVALQIARSPADRVSPVLLALLRVSSRRVVVAIWLLSLAGAATVLSDLGYQKTHRPDQVVAAIAQQSQAPALIAIPHQTHGQTGRLMGLALGLEQLPDLPESQFLLAHGAQDQDAVVTTLRRNLNLLQRPLDLWLINFQTVPEQPLEDVLNQQHCQAEGKSRSVDGYRYRLYRCIRDRSKPPTRDAGRSDLSDSREPDSREPDLREPADNQETEPSAFE
ncbi:MAG: glycosyltransferase family 39 protein [Pegethrix bostrychoides GSE-TBD4-15B]|uniref:Glycosyltransferase family 39 protein n=1 Tax=Pegethrix bostrychoides GSE-TBD4-15B TaxID=2839662 RepID=A0A951U3I0_9CYAN|nr:glycosyltransferase family 39 protein [Pegethrix bostrychoides GSE-TBD4-15B]